jgi:hypothetical protein
MAILESRTQVFESGHPSPSGTYVLTTVPRRFAPDFTTEGTEITETDRKERRVRIRIRNPFLPASVPSVLSVVGLRVAPAAVKFRENRG